MNAGQIMMSMMQGITTSVPEAAVSAGGAQMPGEGGFSDLLVALQTEAQLFQRVPETGNEPILSEPEPVLLQSEGVADLTRNCPEVSNAGAQMILAAYAQPARMPGVTDQPDHDVDMLQNVAETRQTAQPSVTLAAVAAKMGLKQFDEPAPAQFNIPEATASSPATSLQQDGRMPVVNTPPSHDVDAVQNVQGITAGTADQKQFTGSELQAARLSMAVEMSTNTVEAAVQRQPSTPPQKDGGMPVVNSPPSHEADAAQNVHPAPAAQQAEQKSVVAAVVSKAQVFEPAQPVRQAAAVSEQQPAKPVASAPVEVYTKTVGAVLERQPSTPLQHIGGMPIVNTSPGHEVDTVQNVPPAPPVQQAEQTPVTVTAAPKLQAFEPVLVQTVRQAAAVAEQPSAKPVASAPVEVYPKSVEAAVQRQPSTPSQQDGRTPIVNTPPSQEVDAVQNVRPAPPVQQAEQTPVTVTAAPKPQAFEPVHVQTVRQAAAVSEQPSAKPVASAPVERYPKSVEATVQRQPSPQPQQDGRTPVVNTPPRQDVDVVQNVAPAPKLQAFEPVHVQTVRQAAAVAEQPSAKTVASAPVERYPKSVEATVQRQPSPQPQPQQDGRTPVVNTPPRQDVDVVQNVAATSAPKQTLEEITFSLARPISVSRNQPLEQNRTQQTAFVDRPNIISLDLDQIQSRPADIQSAHELLPEGIASVRRQNTGSTAPVANATNLEPLSARKEQPLAGMPVMPTETLLVKSEMDVLEKGKVDIRTASLQRSLHGVPDQIAVGTRLESEKQSSMPKLTKEEDLLLQQSAKPVAETSLTSDDSMGGSADQTGTGQNPDNQMLAHQLHGQSKTEHHNVAALSSDTSKPEPSGQELPERVAHQVRDRLNQHEVKQGSQQITLTLSPENLGELKMNLNLQGQRLSVEILTENRLVRDAILQHSDSLKESLARQNIAVESFDVTANGRGSGNSGHNQDAWKELARQKQQQHFWGSNGVYHPTQVESQINPLAYRAKNEQAMLDIHY